MYIRHLIQDASLKAAVLMTRIDCKRLWLVLALAAGILATSASRSASAGQQTDVQVPSGPLTFGVFVARFDSGGTFTLEGDRWPRLSGNWKSKGSEIELSTSGGPKGCEGPGRYRLRLDGNRVTFDLVSDDCLPRRMILGGSTWSPAGEAKIKPSRRIVRTADARTASASTRPDPITPAGSWPSFRGPQASGIAERQNLPDQWNGKTGENILWRTPIPGLAHSSPVVWGSRIFVTTAFSSDPNATFRPGLYGDGDASKDRSHHKWMIYALDKRTGKILWERIAHQGVPAEKRHIKSTYANSTPATDGRVVVAWFGSQGVHAYDVNGRFLWKVDLGRLDLGAYDIPTYEWGPASSPIIWNGPVRHPGRFIPSSPGCRHGQDRVEDRARRASILGHADRCDNIGRPCAGHKRVELHTGLRPSNREGVMADRAKLEDHCPDAYLYR
jgi:hypothetical protein